MDERQNGQTAKKTIPQNGRPARRPKGQSDDRPGSRKVHLGAEVERRLGVHCALKGTNATKEANRILLGYLAREGRGREVFAAGGPSGADGGEQDAPAAP